MTKKAKRMLSALTTFTLVFAAAFATGWTWDRGGAAYAEGTAGSAAAIKDVFCWAPSGTVTGFKASGGTAITAKTFASHAGIAESGAPSSASYNFYSLPVGETVTVTKTGDNLTVPNKTEYDTSTANYGCKITVEFTNEKKKGAATPVIAIHKTAKNTSFYVANIAEVDVKISYALTGDDAGKQKKIALPMAIGFGDIDSGQQMWAAKGDMTSTKTKYSNKYWHGSKVTHDETAAWHKFIGETKVSGGEAKGEAVVGMNIKEEQTAHFYFTTSSAGQTYFSADFAGDKDSITKNKTIKIEFDPQGGEWNTGGSDTYSADVTKREGKYIIASDILGMGTKYIKNSNVVANEEGGYVTGKTFANWYVDPSCSAYAFVGDGLKVDWPGTKTVYAGYKSYTDYFGSLTFDTQGGAWTNGSRESLIDKYLYKGQKAESRKNVAPETAVFNEKKNQMEIWRYTGWYDVETGKKFVKERPEEGWFEKKLTPVSRNDTLDAKREAKSKANEEVYKRTAEIRKSVIADMKNNNEDWTDEAKVEEALKAALVEEKEKEFLKLYPYAFDESNKIEVDWVSGKHGPENKTVYARYYIDRTYPMSDIGITPANADMGMSGGYAYRTNTDVIMSAWINEGGLADIYGYYLDFSSGEAVKRDGAPPSSLLGASSSTPITATFSCLGNTYTITDIVIPKGGKQLVWFKFHTPSTAQNFNVDVNASFTFMGSEIKKTASLPVRVTELTENTPPDPRAEGEDGKAITMPATFNPAAVMPTETAASSKSWSVWNYSSGSFHQADYSAKLTKKEMAITANEYVKTAQDGGGTIKSGYGFDTRIRTQIGGSPGSALWVTPIQNGNFLFPEFSYGTYNRLAAYLDVTSLATSTSEKEQHFKANKYSPHEQQVHYTPLWYPDGPYKTYCFIRDAWTPMGELTANLSASMNISGDVYDDWHIAPKG